MQSLVQSPCQHTEHHQDPALLYNSLFWLCDSLAQHNHTVELALLWVVEAAELPDLVTLAHGLKLQPWSAQQHMVQRLDQRLLIANSPQF